MGKSSTNPYMLLMFRHWVSRSIQCIHREISLGLYTPTVNDARRILPESDQSHFRAPSTRYSSHFHLYKCVCHLMPSSFLLIARRLPQLLRVDAQCLSVHYKQSAVQICVSSTKHHRWNELAELRSCSIGSDGNTFSMHQRRMSCAEDSSNGSA